VTAKVLTEFSKPPADVAAHTARLIEGNSALLANQRKAALELEGLQRRSRCLLCDGECADVPRFQHRGVPYIECPACGHVQCGLQLPVEFLSRHQRFTKIYPPLEINAYNERTERIYRPKLDWLLRAGEQSGLGDLTGCAWFELGCGAGNFIHALQARGVTNVGGLDAEAMLVDQANGMLKEQLVHSFAGSLADAVKNHSSDIYVAWFVLEHSFEIREFLAALSEKPRGTIFAFSVPTFGLAALLESAFGSHFARSLDSVVHLQMFTDRSIRFALDQAGYEIKAEWLFGQDADDLHRAVVTSIPDPESTNLLREQLQLLAKAVPGIQAAIDRVRLSDSRHVLAVKR